MPSVKIVKETVSLYPEKIKKSGSFVGSLVSAFFGSRNKKDGDSKGGISHTLFIVAAAGVCGLLIAALIVSRVVCRMKRKQAQQKAIIEDIFEEIEELEDEADKAEEKTDEQ